MKYFVFAFSIMVTCFTTSCKSVEKKEEQHVQTTTQNTSANTVRSNETAQKALEQLKDKTKNAQKEIGPFDVDCETLAQGSNAMMQPMVIRNVENAEKLESGFSMIDFDFETNAVVVATAGKRNTGGYSIYLKSAILDGKQLKLIFAVSSPAPDMMVTQALTYPYVVVRVAVPKDVRIIVDNPDAVRDITSLSK